MTAVHIVRNQNGHYWGKGKRWVDGQEGQKVAAHKHRDEAVNTAFELSSKDIELRCDILEKTLVEGKLTGLEISSIPLPDAEEEAGLLEKLRSAPMSEPIEPESVEN